MEAKKIFRSVTMINDFRKQFNALKPAPETVRKIQQELEREGEKKNEE